MSNNIFFPGAKNIFQALAEAQHPRLGVKSPAMDLGPLLLFEIFEKYFAKPKYVHLEDDGVLVFFTEEGKKGVIVGAEATGAKLVSCWVNFNIVLYGGKEEGLVDLDDLMIWNLATKKLVHLFHDDWHITISSVSEEGLLHVCRLMEDESTEYTVWDLKGSIEETKDEKENVIPAQPALRFFAKGVINVTPPAAGRFARAILLDDPENPIYFDLSDGGKVTKELPAGVYFISSHINGVLATPVKETGGYPYYITITHYVIHGETVRPSYDFTRYLKYGRTALGTEYVIDRDTTVQWGEGHAYTVQIFGRGDKEKLPIRAEDSGPLIPQIYFSTPPTKNLY